LPGSLISTCSIASGDISKLKGYLGKLYESDVMVILLLVSTNIIDPMLLLSLLEF
jgi:hypothetical protein